VSEGEITEVQIIPVARIRVANPRVRDKKKFELVVQSIASVGLKRPITVMEGKPMPDGSPGYDLVCGQGRLEAFIALGQTEIPAFVRKMTKSEGLIASLVENIARRRLSAIDQIQTIQWMKSQGNSIEAIAQKTGLSESYTQGILKLLDQGEVRVLEAVLSGRLPLTIAVAIAGISDEAAQQLLVEAYERKALKQVTLTAFRRLLDHRKSFGRGYEKGRQRPRKRTTVDGLILAYKQETNRQRLIVTKAKICEARLRTTTAALKVLLGDENFVTLLRAEELATLPKFIAERVKNTP
jgi:ParB family chromosome partitioning protein